MPLKQNETRVIILHDHAPRAILMMARFFTRSPKSPDGAVLPFDHSSLERLGELLEAVAVLAVGDTELLEEKRPTMPAAGLLLEHLGRKRIGK